MFAVDSVVSIHRKEVYIKNASHTFGEVHVAFQSRKVAAWRTILSSLPNGDWQNPDRVAFHVSAKEVVDPDVRSQEVGEALRSCLLTTTPRLHPCHCSKLAVSSIRLVESCPNLVSTAYVTFMTRLLKNIPVETSR